MMYVGRHREGFEPTDCKGKGLYICVYIYIYKCDIIWLRADNTDAAKAHTWVSVTRKQEEALCKATNTRSKRHSRSHSTSIYVQCTLEQLLTVFGSKISLEYVLTY